MNRDKIRDALELIGIAAIVVSLAFVAFEVRQNTNAIRSTVIHSISQQSFDVIALAIESPELRQAQATVREGSGTAEEQALSDLYFAALLRIHLNRFLQSEIGVIDRQMVLSVGGRRGGGIYSQPIFIDFWENNKDDYSERFQAYMEQYVLPES